MTMNTALTFPSIGFLRVATILCTSILPLRFALNIEDARSGTSTTSLIPNLQAAENVGAQKTPYIRSHRVTRQLTLSLAGLSRAA